MSAVGLVVAGHGELASGLIGCAELIVGHQEGVEAVALRPEDSLESMQAALSEAIIRAERGAGVLVLIDLYGGTPGNAAALSLRDHPVEIVTGVNLPMLLEVMLRREMGTPAKELAEMATETGRAGIVDLRAQLQAP